MLINFLLVFLLFAAAKKKYSPYVSAVILGLIKGALYYFGGDRNVTLALTGFALFTVLAAGLVFFLARVDKKEVTEEPYPKYGGKKKVVFKWEFIPLFAIFILLIMGDLFVRMLFAA